MASRIGGPGLLVFCQVGQGCGGRGSATLGQRRKGNKKIYVWCMCKALFISWEYVDVSIPYYVHLYIIDY